MEKFTIKQFNELYPDDTACLKEIFNNRYGKLKACPSCNARTKFHKVKNRKCYACQFCGYQLHPLADTIFHKSDTSLKSWFYAIFLFANSKNGVSAKELERHLGVTYKTAWRMAKQIRVLFKPIDTQLSDTVEMDETYMGGVSHGHRGRSMASKTAVIGIVQRGGSLVAKVSDNTGSIAMMTLIKKHIKPGSQIMTDEYPSYRKIGKEYTHKTIKHKLGRYVKGDIYTNTIEGFWSQLKRSISGTHHAISRKYLQSYVNEFAYRYSKRHALSSLFFPMVAQAGMPV